MTTDSGTPVNLATYQKKKKQPPPYKTWRKKPSTIQDTKVEATRYVYPKLEESFARNSSQLKLWDQEPGEKVHRLPVECDSEGEEKKE